MSKLCGGRAMNMPLMCQMLLGAGHLLCNILCRHLVKESICFFRQHMLSHICG